MEPTKDRFDLKGAVAVITGAAGRMGPHHSEAIIEGGGKAVLVDINREALDRTVQELKAKHKVDVWGYYLDITKEDEIIKTADMIEKEVGPIQILINNAANNPHMSGDQSAFTRFENFPLTQWFEDLTVGLTGAFLMSKIIGARMAKRGKGSILNICSDLGVIAPDQRIYRKDGVAEDMQKVKPVTYSVDKHGLIGLTKYMATYWATQGVRANAISPTAVSHDQQKPEFVGKLTNLIPMGRLAHIDEYKGAVLFLVSDASSYMTGANLVIDGGKTIW